VIDSGELGDLVAGVPPLLASHLALVLVALAVAVALGLPLAVALARRPRLAAPVITVAGAIQTIPGLALLALMVPLLAASHGLGVGLSSFGFAPAAIALTLYALLPILRNAITGLRGVDGATVEAARGMGMAPAQVLRLVELPLAAPVIAAGIRTASVWTVGPPRSLRRSVSRASATTSSPGCRRATGRCCWSASWPRRRSR